MKTRGRNIALAAAFIAILTPAAGAGFSGLPGLPDVVLHAPPFTIHSGVQNPTHRFEIPPAQPKDRWIRALDFQPCDSGLVQSAYFYVDKTGQWLGTWTPGEKLLPFPDTVAAYLPTTSKVVIDVHYISVSRDIDDCSTVGLYFTDKRPLRPLLGMGIQTPVQIPAGTGLELRKEFTVITDSYAIALQPEMKSAGRSVEISAVDPSGASQVLFGTKNISNVAQSPFVFEQPVFIPKGTRIIAIASYLNPDPQSAAEDVFKLTMSLYPSAEVRPAVYDGTTGAPSKRSTPARKSATTRKTPAKKSSYVRGRKKAPG